MSAKPKDFEPTKLFLFEPSAAERGEFRDWIRNTGSPETWPRLTTTPAPHDVVPVAIFQFSVDRKNRPNLDAIPCSLCSPTDPKFLSGGYLVYYRNEKVVRIIGPECIKTVFGYDTAHSFEGNYAENQRREYAEFFVEENLHKKRAMLDAIAVDEQAAKEAERLHALLKKKCPTAPKIIRQAKKAGGEYFELTQIKNPLTGRQETVKRTLGFISGSEMVLTAFKPVSKIVRIRNLIGDLPDTHSREENFDWLCENGDLESQQTIVDVMRVADKLRHEVVDKISKLKEFFSEEHFRALNRYGSVAPGNVYLVAEMRDDGGFLISTTPGHERAFLKPSFTLLNAFGDWPSITSSRSRLDLYSPQA